MPPTRTSDVKKESSDGDWKKLPYRTVCPTAGAPSARTQTAFGDQVLSSSEDIKPLPGVRSEAESKFLSLHELHALDLAEYSEKRAGHFKTQRVYMATTHHTNMAMTKYTDWDLSLIRNSLFTPRADRTDEQKDWLRGAANSDISLLPSEVWNETNPLPYVHLLKTQAEVSRARRVKVAGLGSSTAARGSHGTGSVVSHVWASSRTYRQVKDMCDLVSATVEPDRRRGDLQSALEMMKNISPDDPYEQPSEHGYGPLNRLGSVAYKMGTHLTRGFHIDVTPETLHRIGADRV